MSKSETIIGSRKLIEPKKQIVTAKRDKRGRGDVRCKNMNHSPSYLVPNKLSWFRCVKFWKLGIISTNHRLQYLNVLFVVLLIIRYVTLIYNNNVGLCFI